MRRGNRGDALVISIVAMAMLIVAGAAIREIVLLQQKRERMNRVKSVVEGVETRIRMALLNSDSFEIVTDDPDGSGPAPAVPKMDSTLSNVVPYVRFRTSLPEFTDFPVLGAQCPASKPGCGVKVSFGSPQLPLKRKLMSGSEVFEIPKLILSYEGTEAKIKNFDLSATNVPNQVIVGLLGAYYSSKNVPKCPTSAPIFVSYLTKANGSFDLNAAGLPKPKCVAATFQRCTKSSDLTSCSPIAPTINTAASASVYRCPNGSVVQGFDASTLTLKCVDLPGNSTTDLELLPLKCANPNEVVGALSFGTDLRKGAGFACHPRVNPYNQLSP